VNLELTDDVAVVIGAARGLGLAIAAQFAIEGARTILYDRSDAVIAEAAKLHSEAEIVDATEYESVRDAERRIRNRHGRIDHVVYAAGVGSGKFGFPFWKLEPADWERPIRVNLLGAVHVAHAFAPGMSESGQGTFAFLASVAGQIGSQTDPPYSAAKAGVINFMQCAAKDLAPFGVRANAINPGMVKTDLNRSVWQAWADRQSPETDRTYEEWTDDKIRNIVPLRRWQTPEDIAQMAVFLASKRAMNVTGQTINVDGGYVMHS
jgi:2-hydroxycyclohexanecarboxyl-CoA dehydrogenase